MENKKIDSGMIRAIDNIVCDQDINIEKANFLADKLTDLISDCPTDELKLFCFDQIQMLAEILFDYTIKLCKDQKELSSRINSIIKKLQSR